MLIKRKEIYDKEKNLLRNVKELKDYYDVNRRIQMQKGIYNKQFENEKR